MIPKYEEKCMVCGSTDPEVEARGIWYCPNPRCHAPGGEAASKHLRKGSKAFVEGRLDIRKYEKDGVQKAVTEVIADAVTFLDGLAAGGEEE